VQRYFVGAVEIVDADPAPTDINTTLDRRVALDGPQDPPRLLELRAREGPEAWSRGARYHSDLQCAGLGFLDHEADRRTPTLSASAPWTAT
jgi:hypothetical protein